MIPRQQWSPTTTANNSRRLVGARTVSVADKRRRSRPLGGAAGRPACASASATASSWPATRNCECRRQRTPQTHNRRASSRPILTCVQEPSERTAIIIYRSRSADKRAGRPAAAAAAAVITTTEQQVQPTRPNEIRMIYAQLASQLFVCL